MRRVINAIIIILLTTLPLLSAADVYEFEQEAERSSLLSGLVSVIDAPDQISQLRGLSAGHMSSFADHQLQSDTLMTLGIGRRFGASVSIHAASAYAKDDEQLSISPEASISLGLGYGGRVDGEGYALLYGISLSALTSLSMQDPESFLIISGGEVSDEAMKLSSGIGLNTGAVIEWANGLSLSADLSNFLYTKMRYTTRPLSQLSTADLLQIYSSDHYEQIHPSGGIDLGYRFGISDQIRCSLSFGLQNSDSELLAEYLRGSAQVVFSEMLNLSFWYASDEMTGALSYRIDPCELLIACSSSGSLHAGISISQSQ